MNFCILALAFVAQVPQPIPVVAPPTGTRVSYAKEIADMLDAKCVGCHSTALAESRLKLEDVAGMLKGGKKGPAIVSGNADASLMFKMAAHRVGPVMPPKEKKGVVPLTGTELGKLKAWIDAGAKDDSDVETTPAKPIVPGKLPPGLHPVNALDVSPDGARVAVGRANVVVVFETETGKELVKLAGHDDLVQSVRFSKDGTKLYAGGYGSVIAWNVPKPAEPKSKPAEPKAADPKEKPAETKAKPAEAKPSHDKAKPSDDKAKSAESWSEAGRFGPHVFRVLALDLSPDGRLLATGGGEPSKSGEIKIWNTADGKLVRTLDGVHSDTVFALKFSPDGQKLLSGGADKFVKIVNAADGKELKSFEGHTHHVLGVDWKSDGKQVVSAGADGAVKFWDVETGEQLRTSQGTQKPLTAVRWPADKPKAVVASADGSVKDVTAANAQFSRTMSTGGDKPDYLYAVATSPDGSRVAAGGADGVVHLWNGLNGQLLRKLESK